MADPMAVTASRARGAAGEGKAAAGSPFRPVLAQNKAFAHYEVRGAGSACESWACCRHAHWYSIQVADLPRAWYGIHDAQLSSTMQGQLLVQLPYAV